MCWYVLLCILYMVCSLHIDKYLSVFIWHIVHVWVCIRIFCHQVCNGLYWSASVCFVCTHIDRFCLYSCLFMCVSIYWYVLVFDGMYHLYLCVLISIATYCTYSIIRMYCMHWWVFVCIHIHLWVLTCATCISMYWYILYVMARVCIGIHQHVLKMEYIVFIDHDGYWLVLDCGMYCVLCSARPTARAVPARQPEHSDIWELDPYEYSRYL